jgi:hypothetical protein
MSLLQRNVMIILALISRVISGVVTRLVTAAGVLVLRVRR